MIISSSNPKFKFLKSLLSSKGIKKEGFCIVPGSKIIKEISSLNDKTISYLDPHADFYLDKKLFSELDLVGTRADLLLKKVPLLKSWESCKEPRGLKVFLPLGDPKNLGAAIRTSFAFNAEEIISLSEAAHPFLQHSIKASAGSVFKASLFSGPSIKNIQGKNFYSLDKQGVDINEIKTKNVSLVLGEEGVGVPSHLKTKSISIKINHQIESLNVNSALSIALYHINKN